MSPVGRPTREVLYQRLDHQIEELWNRLGGLPSPLEAVDIWRDIWFEEAHHSTAIEGNTLVKREVERLLRDGAAVGSKQLREYMEVKGYADASEWVYQQAIHPDTWDTPTKITLTEIRGIHRLAMAPVWGVQPPPEATERETPGAFREHEIESFASGWQPPSWVLVEAELQAWLEQARELKVREPLFAEKIAALHCRFEQIHPFLDGNGRTGRLVLNLILVRMGYPPAIIYKGDRAAYLRALRRADSGDCGALGEFVARAILQNLYRFVVPAIAGPARLVPIAALATSAVSPDALRTAAARGALQATKGEDGQWRSSKNWVDEYVASRHKRRGP